MIYTPLTCEAMKIAYRAHHGQLDKSGIPYIFHPIHLAEQMPDELTTCVALLHDIVEDTDLTLEDLKAVFPEAITDAVALMTHHPEVPYLEYVLAIKENPIARIVKIADLTHNSDATRLAGITIDREKHRARLEKYQQALEILR
jgi:(p)ppGpp synthase/HD superfamily hydrolase